MKLFGKKVVMGNNRAVIKYTVMLIYVLGFDYSYKNFDMPLWLAVACFVLLIALGIYAFIDTRKIFNEHESE